MEQRLIAFDCKSKKKNASTRESKNIANPLPFELKNEENTKSSRTRAESRGRFGKNAAILNTYVFVAANGLSIPDLYLRFVRNALFVFNSRGSKNIGEAYGLMAAQTAVRFTFRNASSPSSSFPPSRQIKYDGINNTAFNRANFPRC